MTETEFPSELSGIQSHELLAIRHNASLMSILYPSLGVSIFKSSLQYAPHAVSQINVHGIQQVAHKEYRMNLVKKTRHTLFKCNLETPNMLGNLTRQRKRHTYIRAHT